MNLGYLFQYRAKAIWTPVLVRDDLGSEALFFFRTCVSREDLLFRIFDYICVIRSQSDIWT
jgi:hypothetical protein